MAEKRGSIGFFATYRPPIPLDLYSSPIPPTSARDEVHLTDGKSYNYNGHVIPPAALKAILRLPKLATVAKPGDVDSGRVSGMVFVSERTQSLETLHIALRFNTNPTQVKVFNFAEVYGTFDGARIEDSPCFAGDYLVYISTKDDPNRRREPWNAVYRTHLATAKTDRLTPKGVADFSSSVSPSGRKIVVASLQFKEEGWDGEIEDLKSDIFIMDIDEPFTRKAVIRNGGWPTWGSDNVLFFHRRVEKTDADNKKIYKWGVFRADITNGFTSNTPQVTPEDIDAMTPAAIDANTVAVATIRDRLMIDKPRTQVDHYRHIEIFDSSHPQKVVQITQKTNPLADHYNPFIMKDNHGKQCIGYHRCNREHLKIGDVSREFDKVKSPQKDVGAFRVSGVFPTFSKDGKKLAFVDNDFKNVWLADEKGLRAIYTTEGPDSVFSPVWNQDPEKDILYVCMGPSFHANDPVNIGALIEASSGSQNFQRLNKGYNNAFPSTNPEGTKLVFRSTRAGPEQGYKNLYIMDAILGEYGSGASNKLIRLTQGPWTDTHCQWSPNGDWIVFSSSRRRPDGVIKRDDLPDPGYFGVYLINSKNPNSWVRVIGSGNDINDLPGHVNHPFFSPDGRSLVFASDLAGVSVDPISLPLFLHSVRSYGDIFSVDIDPKDINKNKDVTKFNRFTHSRYENSTPSWTMFSTQDPVVAWNQILNRVDPKAPRCPFANPGGAESWHLTGHLCIPRRCC